MRVVVTIFVLTSSVIFAAPFHLYVSNERSGDITVIDGSTLAPVQTIPVGTRPRGLHVSPDGHTLYVATSGSPRMGPGTDPERAKNLTADKSADGIALIDLATSRVVRRLNVGSDPEEFALSRDGSRLFVANEDIATASIWDAATGREIATAQVTEEPEGVAVHPTANEVWITCEEDGDIFVLHSDTGTRITDFRLGGRPRTITFTNDGTLAFIPLETSSAIAIVDAQQHRLLETIEIAKPALPMGSALSPDGRELYVTTGRGNTVVVLDTVTRKIVATIPVGERPRGIALSPDRKLLFTANGPSNDISVIDIKARRELRRIPAGQGPWGLAISK